MTFCGKSLKKIGFAALCCVLLFLVSLAATGEACAKTRARTTHHKKHARVTRTLPAKRASHSDGRYAAIVIDADTGRILIAANSGAQRHPASLTKMMTLYLTFQAIESGRIRLDTSLSVSAKAASQSPTKLGLRAGQSIRVYDAIMGLITESANDAAWVIAENLGGSESRFIELMNKQARALGMDHTFFHNPSGLPDPAQTTTAEDMAMLGSALISHYPGFYPYFSHQSFTYAGRVHHNHNHLMERYDGMDGIKTGYVRASGFNLVASAVHGEMRLIGVIFGGTSAPGRDKQMEALLDKAFALAAQKAGPERVSMLPLPSKVAEAFPPRGGAALAANRPQAREKTVPVTASPAAPQAEAANGSGGAWGIQIGAYSDVANAQQVLTGLSQSMGSLLAQAEPGLQKITMADGSAVYRARFTGLDQNAARAACAHLVQRGQGCMVFTGP